MDFLPQPDKDHKLLRSEKFNELLERLSRTGLLPHGMVHMDTQRGLYPSVWVKITGDATGGGWYNGLIMDGELSSTGTSNLNLPEGMPTGQACLIGDFPENGKPSHRIGAGTYLPGILVGHKSNSEVAIVFVDYGRRTFQPVTLTQTGGADGTNSTACTYTYTATDLDGDVVGTVVPVVAQRPNGSMVPATRGMCLGTAGTTQIWWCDEVPNTETCDS